MCIVQTSYMNNSSGIIRETKSYNECSMSSEGEGELFHTSVPLINPNLKPDPLKVCGHFFSIDLD
jgi:hypothetical protein